MKTDIEMMLEDAVCALNDEIDDGAEFPDALHRVADRCGFSDETLREAYDEQFNMYR